MADVPLKTSFKTKPEAFAFRSFLDRELKGKTINEAVQSFVKYYNDAQRSGASGVLIDKNVYPSLGEGFRVTPKMVAEGLGRRILDSVGKNPGYQQFLSGMQTAWSQQNTALESKYGKGWKSDPKLASSESKIYAEKLNNLLREEAFGPRINHTAVMDVSTVKNGLLKLTGNKKYIPNFVERLVQNLSTGMDSSKGAQQFQFGISKGGSPTAKLVSSGTRLVNNIDEVTGSTEVMYQVGKDQSGDKAVAKTFRRGNYGEVGSDRPQTFGTTLEAETPSLYRSKVDVIDPGPQRQSLSSPTADSVLDVISNQDKMRSELGSSLGRTLDDADLFHHGIQDSRVIDPNSEVNLQYDRKFRDKVLDRMLWKMNKNLPQPLTSERRAAEDLVVKMIQMDVRSGRVPIDRNLVIDIFSRFNQLMKSGAMRAMPYIGIVGDLLSAYQYYQEGEAQKELRKQKLMVDPVSKKKIPVVQ